MVKYLNKKLVFVYLLLYYLSGYSAFMQNAEKTIFFKKLLVFFYQLKYCCFLTECNIQYLQPLESDIFSGQFILNNVLTETHMLGIV